MVSLLADIAPRGAAHSGGITMNKIITISREYGAGGHSIGTQVAKELGIPFYDRDIVRETAKASGFDIELIEREGESESFADSILKNLFTVPGSYYNDTREAIYEVQKAIILRLAKQGPCVILGRCADHILKEAGIDAINVFIHANELHRGSRVTECAHSNISILKDGVLRTAPTDELILPGITRKHLIELAKQNNIPVDESPFSMVELMNADEIIVTSSSALCIRVATIDKIPVGGKDPERIKLLQDAYWNKFVTETTPKA
jgi:cytidylate kinase